MLSFNGILYAADLPIAGVDVEACFKADSLYINTTSVFVSIKSITMRIGGFEHDELHLDWLNAEGQPYTLKPYSKNDIAYVIENAPPALKAQFSQWHKRRRTIKLVWSSLATVCAVSVVSLGMLWWRYDEAVSWLASQVSIQNEERLGNSVLKQIEADGKVIRQGLAVETIQTIGQRLTKGSRYQYQWLIQQEDSINAFALPGGIIIVNSMLIAKAENADELAAVLAHEIQHVEQQHALKRTINSLGWATGLLIVLGDVNAATAVIAHQMGNMFFSRDIEEDADNRGFQALVQANISPAGMISLLEKLQKEYGGGDLEWFSSHPDIAKRIKNIQALHTEQPCASCEHLVFDWQKIQQDIVSKQAAESGSNKASKEEP